MKNKLDHIPEALKSTVDATAFISVLTTWAIALTPLLEFAVLVLAFVWGYFRIKDLFLAMRLKKLKIRRHEDIKDK